MEAPVGRPRLRSSAQGQRCGARGEARTAVSGNPEGGGLSPEWSHGPRLSGPSRALLRSRGGPMAGLPVTSFPTALHSRFDAQPFRVLLLRRLWLP